MAAGKFKQGDIVIHTMTGEKFVVLYERPDYPTTYQVQQSGYGERTFPEYMLKQG